MTPEEVNRVLQDYEEHMALSSAKQTKPYVQPGRYVLNNSINLCDYVLNNSINLCDSCKYDFPECPSGKDDVLFGDGKGNDNICCCNKYQTAQKVGKWICDYKDIRYASYHCDVCGRKLQLCSHIDIKVRMSEGRNLYCDGCGAKMERYDETTN